MIIWMYNKFIFNLVDTFGNVPDILHRKFEEIYNQTANWLSDLDLNNLKNDTNVNKDSDKETNTDSSNGKRTNDGALLKK